MEETNKTAKQETGGLPPIIPRISFDLRLRSLKSSRQTLARVLREYGRGGIDEATFKSLLYGMNIFLGFLKESSAEELEARLAGIERKLSDLEGGSHARRAS